MKLRTALAALAVLGVAPALAQQGDGTDIAYPVSVFKPNKLLPTSDKLAQISAPEGFTVEPFAAGLGNVRILAVADDGTIYASRREEGDVIMLRDADGDGKADKAPVVVATRPQTHGIAIHEGRLYIATVKEIFVGDILDDGTIGELEMIVGDLPDAGQHPNRVLEFGPDGMIYYSSGSTCNACNESNAENAAMLRMTPDGASRTIFASGLRNTIGYDWHPETGELWGLDHGIDFLGDDVQPEELNRLEQGKQYGWPHVHGEGDFNPQSTPVGGITKQQWRDQSEPMVIGYTAHAAPMQFRFYTGSGFPAEYQGDAFATMRGSWNRNPASGYEIVHIAFENGEPTAIEPFVTGFLTDDGTTHIARPVGLAVAADGALLMADDANGVIYRIAYDGEDTAAEPAAAAPSDAMEQQAAEGVGVPLALEREETATEGEVTVSSPTIEAGASIPEKHSDYADGVSPALAWNMIDGAASYAIIMEDPDAAPITPFVHWVAWNIPASVFDLPEGLQEQPRLVAPEGMMQGRNSAGTNGYFGPKPPVGDPVHHYHFQILALDKLLDLPATADRDDLLAAMEGHVLAKGELVGLYQQSVEPPK
ncbi:Raf kinase inhibitor-like protein, YbhB/YbcL family [Devosia crocina]|uniref:Raf kinase inhibitor-like protein, YbhB/YbcL family n=1 Tax=Devosia crocina TaxID=429728 RepID=A0A1I7MZW7_9HYPH|nr:YbhB/YbcL family Raf kinase inhibitor-like protein [Devosia crocina]SFV27951.1 Raf kinase inhibitor-like protein, YbhB/YbcL family [Devosia crocina]